MYVLTQCLSLCKWHFLSPKNHHFDCSAITDFHFLEHDSCATATGANPHLSSGITVVLALTVITYFCACVIDEILCYLWIKPTRSIPRFVTFFFFLIC